MSFNFIHSYVNMRGSFDRAALVNKLFSIFQASFLSSGGKVERGRSLCCQSYTLDFNRKLYRLYTVASSNSSSSSSRFFGGWLLNEALINSTTPAQLECSATRAAHHHLRFHSRLSKFLCETNCIIISR
uniref:Uncharacterized protein n=1 Tax=Trichogramma kaykai TaxID=54128 RepID=A0ABD2WWP3_9HYME